MTITIGKTTIDIDPKAILYARRSLTYVSETSQRIPGVEKNQLNNAAAALTRLHDAMAKQQAREDEEEIVEEEELPPKRTTFTGMPEGVRAFVDANYTQRMRNQAPTDINKVNAKIEAMMLALAELENGHDNLSEDIRKIDNFLCGQAPDRRTETAINEAIALLRHHGLLRRASRFV